MAIPEVVGEMGLLPPGRHPASMAEVEGRFVLEAPFSGERAIIAQSLNTWMMLVEQLVPVSRYWIDGGFVTHKTWAAPSDVDVTIICQEADLARLGEDGYERLRRLLTEVRPDGTRIKPMDGRVDAFLTTRSGPDANVPYWMSWWANVRAENGTILDGLTKGYLEVIP